jgi:hypothetical protein
LKKRWIAEPGDKTPVKFHLGNEGKRFIARSSNRYAILGGERAVIKGDVGGDSLTLNSKSTVMTSHTSFTTNLFATK